MHKTLFKDIYFILIGPVLFMLPWLVIYFQSYLGKFETIFAKFPQLIFNLMIIGLLFSFLSLFLLPRYVKKSVDDKRIWSAVIISLVVIAPLVIVLGGWLNYAT